jgi:MazG family protein
VGVAIEELSDLTTKLRRECVWDQEQTHESLLPHLVEEAYEALDAIAEYVANGEDADSTHVAEELGDLLFQIAFHAELGHEIGAFDLTLIADGVREKLIARHPHVFGDVVVTDAQDAANRWEQLKKIEKQRDSVTDGIATQLPALTLYPKLWRKASAVGADGTDPDEAIEIASRALTRIESGDVDRATLVDLIEVAVVFSAMRGIDLEGALRERALELRALIRRWESRSSS